MVSRAVVAFRVIQAHFICGLLLQLVENVLRLSLGSERHG